MSDSKAKVYQIVCRLELCRRPHWGSLQRTQTRQLDFRDLLLREGRERREEKIGVNKTERKRGKRGNNVLLALILKLTTVYQFYFVVILTFGRTLLFALYSSANVIVCRLSVCRASSSYFILQHSIKQIIIITVDYKNIPEGYQRSKGSLNWPPILLC